jgi:hypothetical protein
MTNVPSFQTMDQLHFLATGERMPPIAGDACPHPPDYYIQKTHQRQQRSRAYAMLVDTARVSSAIIPVKPGEVNGTPYDRVLGIRGGLVLFKGDTSVMTLWPDGRDHVEPTPPSSEASSPRKGFRLRTPPFGTSAPPPTARSMSPIAVGIPVEMSRLRPNFRRFLADLSTDALAVEFEEWEEDLRRAQEHVDAIREEMTGRSRK